MTNAPVSDKQDAPAAETPRPRWRRVLRWTAVGLFSALVVTGMLAGLAAWLIHEQLHESGIPGPEQGFTLPEGSTGHDMGRVLAKHGLIEHELLFRLALRLHDGNEPIRHGYYRIPEGLSPMELVERVYEGPEAARAPSELPPELRVTIPEGLSLEQMAKRFDDPEAFKEAASDPELIARLGIEADTLEGFLMPNTYFFDEKPSEAEVVERMVEQFERDFARLAAEFPETEERDLMELVTVASLVEREARAAHERPKVASVIENRLERGMTLDMDTTLQYALGKYGERMLNEDKEVDSPYNTYRNRGLPPGPIANPGLASFRAALDPADTEYLYFVSNADGRTHTFSRTLEEHNRAVYRYRQEMASQRRALQESSNGDDTP